MVRPPAPGTVPPAHRHRMQVLHLGVRDPRRGDDGLLARPGAAGQYLRGVAGRVLHPLVQHQAVTRLLPRRLRQHVAPPVGVPRPCTGGGPPGTVAVAERREHAAVAVVPEDAEVGGVDRRPARRAVRRLLAGDPADLGRPHAASLKVDQCGGGPGRGRAWSPPTRELRRLRSAARHVLGSFRPLPGRQSRARRPGSPRRAPGVPVESIQFSVQEAGKLSDGAGHRRRHEEAPNLADIDHQRRPVAVRMSSSRSSSSSLRRESASK